MHSLRHEVLPPSGVEHATSLKLLPSTLGELPALPNTTASQAFVARTLCNVVVARSSLLRIFEAREEPAPLSSQVDEERDRRANVRKGTEAVEGEVAMDEQGEGFVNIESVGQKSDVSPPTITKLYLVREHRLHGIVTGMEGVKIISTLEDKLDRLLVSFKDAKVRNRRFHYIRSVFNIPLVIYRLPFWSGRLQFTI